MLRTLFMLFLFVDLNCDRVAHSQRITDNNVTDSSISILTTQEVDFTTVSSDYDLRLNSLEVTESIFDGTYNYEESYMNSVNCSITKFTYESHPNSIKVNWNDCKDTYNVNITKAFYDGLELPYFRRENGFSHTFINLRECTAYNISIKPDSGDVYQATIRTLPGESLITTINDNLINVIWKASDFQDCPDYKILVNGTELLQNGSTSASIRYNQLRCTTIEVTLLNTQDNRRNVATRLVPGAVSNINITFGSNNIDLTWEEPEDTSCVTGYLVQLNEETPFETNELSYTFSNLNACTQYTVGIAAKSDTEIGIYTRQTGSTSVPTQLAAVQNLNLQHLGDKLTATWDPPYLQAACITDYGVVIWDQYGTTINTKIKVTTYDIEPLVPCQEYHVMIMALRGESSQGAPDTKIETISADITNPPRLISVSPNKTSSTLNLRLDTYSINMCNITEVIVNCTATENEPHDWIKEGPYVVHSHKDSSTSRQVTILIEELSEYTNYTCYAYVNNIEGMSDESAPISFLTQEEVPSVPQNLNYTEDQDGGLITWDVPYKIPGIQENYRVIIYPSPIHYISEDCYIPVNNITGETRELQFRLNEVLPSYRYSIAVSASTGAGFGEEATLDIIRPPAKSEVPRNVTYDFTNLSGETYEVSVNLNWLLPCNTNGNFTHYNLTLEGQSLENNESYIIIETIEVNDPISDINYKTTVPNIKALYNYNAILVAFVDEQLKIPGDEYILNFTSPDGYPSAPENLKIENLTATFANISWQEPLNKNGALQSYRIIINTIGPVHYIRDDCGIEYNLTDTYYVEDTVLSYSFEGLPNFHYSVSVAARTTAGYGTEATLHVITLQDESEVPTNVNPNLQYVLGETYAVWVDLSWKLPCNTNGNLTNFNWTLEGQPLENGEPYTIEESVEPNDPISDINYKINITDITALYNYSLTLVAYVDGQIRGEEYTWNFSSPDGYSSPPQNLIVENLTATSAVILWREPLNKNGEIQKYRIIVDTTGPVHYIPTDCNIEYNLTDTYDVEDTELSYSFEGLPNFHYSVSVAAKTRAGYGYNATIEFTTLQDESEMPRAVSYKFDNIPGETYNVSIIFNWLLPCNTNGNFTSFSWILEGQSLENDDNYEITGHVLPNSLLENIDYELTIPNLRAVHNYTLSLAASAGTVIEIIGKAYTEIFSPPDGYPSAPLNLRVENLTPNSGRVVWEEPLNRNGIIQSYKILLTPIGPLHDVPNDCTIDYGNVTNVTLEPTTFNFPFDGLPNFNYTVRVAAATRRDYGPESIETFATLEALPDPVRNITTALYNPETEAYQAYITMSFYKPCNLNGEFTQYTVQIFGQREGFQNDEHAFDIIDYNNNSFIINLQPQFRYYGHIDINTKSYSSSKIIDIFDSPAGVPPARTSEVESPVATTTTTARFTFNNDFFDKSQGDIKYYAFIIYAAADISTETGGGFSFWNSSFWPNSGYWSNVEGQHVYQATPEHWNPFIETRNIDYTYIIGEDNNCSADGNSYCNGPLRPDTQYSLKIRGFTDRAYRDSNLLHFVTPAEENYLGLILGLIFGILTAILLLFFIFILWRRKKKEKEDKVTDKTVTPQMEKPSPIAINKFVDHYRMFEENRNQLKAEYSHLERLSAIERPSSHVAMAEDNKRKNRYINIMAYDETRVKLATDSNDNYEDYINASYIKGYSGNPEYIATQGPMMSTVGDFWRMMIQEDVTIIVMVAQFVEQSKQKCYTYFPDKEETLTVEENINIKCTNEINFTDYVTRTLIVEKNGEQRSIKHIQFTAWPDFGCPNTTSSMLEFRDIMRKHVETTKNKAVIHCSAGVGRTGTLIAIDILLQKIDNSEENIDIFSTVLNLRRQRTNMVQTVKQYEYIHKCIKDYLIKPTEVSDVSENYLDPIYENVMIINGRTEIRDGSNNTSTENLIRLKQL